MARPVQRVTAPYLAPHSSDFDPIEMAFAKLEALLRAAAAQTIPDLWQDGSRRVRSTRACTSTCGTGGC
jgi:hypothetical protein